VEEQNLADELTFEIGVNWLGLKTEEDLGGELNFEKRPD
jgi:hypothetical protein